MATTTNSIINLLLRLQVESNAAKAQLSKEFAAIKATGVEASNAITSASNAATQGVGAFSQLSRSLRQVKDNSQGIGKTITDVADGVKVVASTGSNAFTQIAQSLGTIKDSGLDAAQGVADVATATKSVSETGAGVFNQLSRGLAGISDSSKPAAKGVDDLSKSTKSLEPSKDVFFNMAKGLVGATQAAKPASDAVDDTGKKTNLLTRYFSNLRAESIGVAGGMEKLVTSVRAVATGFVGLAVVQTLKGFADTAARTEVLDTVLKQVALNAGISNSAVAKLDADVQKLGITAAASRQALTTFIQAGLDVSKASALARAAQDLAVVAGEDSSTVFQRVITNVQQLDTVGLKYNGVIVSLEEATRNYLQALGQQSRELTKAEQQQAVLNEVLLQASKLSGIYEKSLGDVGKQLSSLNRYQNEAAVSLGNNLLPTYLLLVQEFTTFLQQSKLITDSYSQQGEGAKTLANALKPLVVTLRQIAVFVVENIEVISKLVAAYLSIKAATLVFAALASVASVLGTAIISLYRGFVILNTVINLVATKSIPALIVASRAFIVASAPALLNPIVLGFVALALAVAGAVAAYKLLGNARKESARIDELTKGNGEGLQDALANNLTKQILATEELNNAKAALVASQKAGDQQAIDDAEKLKKTTDERLKSLKAEETQLRKIANTKGISTDPSVDQAAANRAQLEIQKQAATVRENLKNLKLDSENASKGLNIGPEYAKQLGQVSTLLDDFFARTRDGNGQVIVSFGQVSLAIGDLVDSAKGFDEIGAALDLIRKKAQGNGGPLISALVETATFNQGKAAITELDKVLGGYISKVAETAKNTALLRGIAADTQSFANGLRTTFFELGSGLTVANNGIVEFSTALAKVAGTRSGIASLEAQASSISVNASRQRYKEEEKSISDLDARRKELAASQARSAADTATMVEAIDRDSINRRIDNAKTYYDSLRTQQDAYASKVQESARRIRDIEQQVNANRKSEEQAIFDLRLQGMTEQERLSANISRSDTIAAATRTALAKGDLELAKQSSDEQIDIAKALASSAKNEQERFVAAERIKTAYAAQRDVLAQQKKDEEERQRLQVETLNALTTSLNNLKQTFSDLTASGANLTLNIDRTALDAVNAELDAGKSTKVTFSPDDSSLRALRDSVQQALDGIKFQVNAGAQAVQGFAGGGAIRGPGTGTSDSILMWGSNGEFMLRKAAVDKYGESFLHGLNQGAIPKQSLMGYADGGSIGADPGSPDMAGIGHSTLDIKYNGRKLGRISGSRETIKNFNAMLNELTRGGQL